MTIMANAMPFVGAVDPSGGRVTVVMGEDAIVDTYPAPAGFYRCGMETTFDRVSYSYGRVRALTEVSSPCDRVDRGVAGANAPASRPQWT